MTRIPEVDQDLPPAVTATVGFFGGSHMAVGEKRKQTVFYAVPKWFLVVLIVAFHLPPYSSLF